MKACFAVVTARAPPALDLCWGIERRRAFSPHPFRRIDAMSEAGAADGDGIARSPEPHGGDAFLDG